MWGLPKDLVGHPQLDLDDTMSLLVFLGPEVPSAEGFVCPPVGANLDPSLTQRLWRADQL